MRNSKKKIVNLYEEELVKRKESELEQKVLNQLLDNLKSLNRNQKHKVIGLVIQFFDFNFNNDY